MAFYHSISISIIVPRTIEGARLYGYRTKNAILEIKTKPFSPPGGLAGPLEGGPPFTFTWGAHPKGGPPSIGEEGRARRGAPPSFLRVPQAVLRGAPSSGGPLGRAGRGPNGNYLNNYSCVLRGGKVTSFIRPSKGFLAKNTGCTSPHNKFAGSHSGSNPFLSLFPQPSPALRLSPGGGFGGGARRGFFIPSLPKVYLRGFCPKYPPKLSGEATSLSRQNFRFRPPTASSYLHFETPQPGGLAVRGTSPFHFKQLSKVFPLRTGPFFPRGVVFRFTAWSAPWEGCLRPPSKQSRGAAPRTFSLLPNPNGLQPSSHDEENRRLLFLIYNNFRHYCFWCKIAEGLRSGDPEFQGYSLNNYPIGMWLKIIDLDWFVKPYEKKLWFYYSFPNDHPKELFTNFLTEGFKAFGDIFVLSPSGLGNPSFFKDPLGGEEILNKFSNAYAERNLDFFIGVELFLRGGQPSDSPKDLVFESVDIKSNELGGVKAPVPLYLDYFVQNFSLPPQFSPLSCENENEVIRNVANVREKVYRLALLKKKAEAMDLKKTIEKIQVYLNPAISWELPKRVVEYSLVLTAENTRRLGILRSEGKTDEQIAQLTKPLQDIFGSNPFEIIFPVQFFLDIWECALHCGRFGLVGLMPFTQFTTMSPKGLDLLKQYAIWLRQGVDLFKEGIGCFSYRLFYENGSYKAELWPTLLDFLSPNGDVSSYSAVLEGTFPEAQELIDVQQFLKRYQLSGAKDVELPAEYKTFASFFETEITKTITTNFFLEDEKSQAETIAALKQGQIIKVTLAATIPPKEAFQVEGNLPEKDLNITEQKKENVLHDPIDSSLKNNLKTSFSSGQDVQNKSLAESLNTTEMKPEDTSFSHNQIDAVGPLLNDLKPSESSGPGQNLEIQNKSLAESKLTNKDEKILLLEQFMEAKIGKKVTIDPKIRRHIESEGNEKKLFRFDYLTKTLRKAVKSNTKLRPNAEKDFVDWLTPFILTRPEVASNLPPFILPELEKGPPEQRQQTLGDDPEISQQRLENRSSEKNEIATDPQTDEQSALSSARGRPPSPSGEADFPPC